MVLEVEKQIENNLIEVNAVLINKDKYKIILRENEKSEDCI